ncbi:MAG: hypothetical protein ABIO70_31830 [Pseudomonadota bacterium]
MLPALLLIAQLTAAALGEAPADAVPEPPVDGLSRVLDLAGDLAAEGQDASARATLDWVLDQQPDAATRARAEQMQASLAEERGSAAPVFLLTMWQAGAGSYLLGPHLAYLFWDPARSATPYFVGAAAGAVVGGGSALYLGLGPGLDGPQALTIFSGEVLGGANGYLVGAMIDDESPRARAIGVLAGTGLGAAAGVYGSTLHPSRAEALALPSGAAWGTGLSFAVVGLVEPDEPIEAEWPFLVGMDAGAAGAVLLTRALDLSPAQIALFDLGGVVGAASMGLVLLLAEEADADLEARPVIALVTLSALGTGALGAALGARLEDADPVVSHALLSGEREDLHVAIPVPHLRPVERETGLGLTLVDCRF